MALTSSGHLSVLFWHNTEKSGDLKRLKSHLVNGCDVFNLTRMPVDSVPRTNEIREKMWVPGPDGDMYVTHSEENCHTVSFNLNQTSRVEV